MDLTLHDVFLSCLRWAEGLLLAAMLALIVSLVLATMQKVFDASIIITSFFRALPILALVPLFQTVIGVNEYAKVLLIAWACFFPIVISTAYGLRNRSIDLERRIQLQSASFIVLYRHYIIPRVLRSFLAGVEIAVGIGWLTVVAAEIIGTFNQGFFGGGLGYYVFTQFENGKLDNGFFGLLIFGLLGVSTTALWKWAAHFVWRRLYDNSF